MKQELFFNQNVNSSPGEYIQINDFNINLKENEEIILNIYAVFDTGENSFLSFSIEDQNDKKIICSRNKFNTEIFPAPKYLEFTGILLSPELNGKKLYFYSSGAVQANISGIGFKG